MKAKYVGDTGLPEDDRGVPDSMQAFGLTFEKGKLVDIPPELEAKIAGNRHFEVSGTPETDEGKRAASESKRATVPSSDGSVTDDVARAAETRGREAYADPPAADLNGRTADTGGRNADTGTTAATGKAARK